MVVNIKMAAFYNVMPQIMGNGYSANVLEEFYDSMTMYRNRE